MGAALWVGEDRPVGLAGEEAGTRPGSLRLTRRSVVVRVWRICMVPGCDPIAPRLRLDPSHPGAIGREVLRGVRSATSGHAWVFIQS